MADQKISQLTGATTPLAGTEVLPIVQSSTTKKVSVANLTAGRDVSVANLTSTKDVIVRGTATQVNGVDGLYLDYTSGTSTVKMEAINPGNAYLLMQINAGTMYLQTNGVTRYTLDSTGNLVQGTAAKGVNFTANTPAAGMTSQLLNWYEEGTWTPVATAGSGAITTYSSSGRYTRVGRQVFLQGRVTLTTVGTAGGRLTVDGFPFTVASTFTPSSTCREVAATGVIYAVFGETGGAYGYISSLTNGAIAWTDGYIYDFNLVYTV